MTTSIPSIKGIRGIKPIKAIREIPPLKPLMRDRWSSVSLVAFLALGEK